MSGPGVPLPPPAEAPEIGADEAAAVANSAHPAIHRLNPDLTPEEFELVFEASRAEMTAYQIICDAELAGGDPVILRESCLTLYRKQSDGHRQAGGIQFLALAGHEGSSSDAPDHEGAIAPAALNNRAVLRALAAASQGTVDFEIADCFSQAGQMPLAQLLHLMECAGIGRPSTYAVTLEKLFEDSAVLVFDAASGMVTLTANGVELAARLETRCDSLSSQNFAGAFDRKLDAMASGLLPPAEFLAWILSLTRPGDPLAAAAAAKLWDSVDDLRTDRIASPTPAAQGGYISNPAVTKPAAASQPPNPDGTASR